jgi:hypothetical protein
MELAELLRFQRSTRRYSNLKERATLFFRTPEHDKISNSVSNDKKTVELISSLENDVTTLQRAIDNIEHYNLDLVKSMRFLSISYAVHQIYDILVTLSQAKICGAQIENFTVPLESHQATILEIADKITNLSDEFKGSSSSEDTTPHLGCCMKRLHLAVSNANVLKCYEIYASMERVDGLKVMIYGGGLQDIFQLRINIARQCNQTDFIDSTNFRLMFLNYSRTVYKELMEIRNNSVVKRLITARAEQMKQGLNLLLSNIRETQTNTVTLNGAGSFLDVRQRILTVSYIEDIIACLNAHSTLLETPELKRLERSQFPNILDAIGQIRVSASLGYISARHHRDAINTLFGEYLTEEEAAYLEIKSKGIYDSYLAIPVNQEQDSPLILIQKAIENSMNSRAQITSTGASSSNLQNQSARNTSKSKKKASKKSNR